LVYNKQTRIIAEIIITKRYKTLFLQHFYRFDYSWMQRWIVTCCRDVDIYIIVVSEQIKMLQWDWV